MLQTNHSYHQELPLDKLHSSRRGIKLTLKSSFVNKSKYTIEDVPKTNKPLNELYSERYSVKKSVEISASPIKTVIARKEKRTEACIEKTPDS